MSKYVVVDLEMCGVPKPMRKNGFIWANETIQIGAVLLNEQYDVTDTFNTYVHPKRGYLDYFIEELTGITKKDVVNAPTIDVALEDFLNWIPDEDVKIVAWSESDKNQIRHEIIGNGLTFNRMNELYENWIDCQVIFSQKMKSDRIYKLSEALIAADIVFNGREHNGLDDAYNTALLFAKMMKEPELILNKIYASARSEECSHLLFGIGDLFKEFTVRTQVAVN